MSDHYQKCSPCKASIKGQTLLGRIIKQFNLFIVEFSTPHGSRYEIDTSCLQRISHDEMEDLQAYERDSENIRLDSYVKNCKRREILT